jgi:hypothetical protein
MNAYELAKALEIRAGIRRQITTRKSVQEGEEDRLSNQLEEAARMIIKQAQEILELRNTNTYFVLELADCQRRLENQDRRAG